MIEIISPGWPSLIVDGGRFGAAAVGVPTSAALDRYALTALHRLVGSPADSPVLEVVGAGFALRFHCSTALAITGARVKATLDDHPVRPWASFRASAGSTLRVREVLEGFRYYIGFAGDMDLERVMGSYSTHVECGFGGYRGRILKSRDCLALKAHRDTESGMVREIAIPVMHPPHRLRVVAGPELSLFTGESCRRFMERDAQTVYDVSAQTNRIGIRLEGEPLCFRVGADKSIISEGILPGTVQIPGDGRPIIMLNERTIGGYARIAMVVKADQDRLAHLKPGDPVLFELVDAQDACRLWEDRIRDMESLDRHIMRLK